MRRLLAVLTIVAFVVGACSADETDSAPTSSTTTSTSTSSTSTSVAPSTSTSAPATSCDAVTEVNFAFDEIARTMLATMSGEEPGEFVLVLGDAVDLLEATAAMAPADVAEPSRHLATTYAGFEALLIETDYDVLNLPTDDPRAAELSAPAFTDAVVAITEECA